jgi:F-type H+-transporting ATPase subunit b
MSALLLLAQPGEGGQVEQIARTFGVDWPHFLAQVISFAIVCALLFRFAYKPILAMLDERREQIAQGLANAAQIKAELARTEAQRQEVIGEANAQATRLIEEAREIVARAREAAAQDHARMLVELKREVGRLVVQTTAAVTGKVLTPEDQRRLAEETARRVSA